MQPTRLEVFNKLETLKGLSKEEQLAEITAWASTVSDTPEKIIDDLASYPNYAK